MGAKGIPIDSNRLEEALKMKGISKRAFAKMISEKNGINAESTRATVQRWFRTPKMSETNLLMISEMLDVSPLYIEGKLTKKAKRGQRKDSNGVYVPTYMQYHYETNVKPYIAEIIRYPGEDFFKYLFDKYEITSADGIRYQSNEIIPEQLESSIVKAIQDYYRQWNYKEFPHVTYKIESED